MTLKWSAVVVAAVAITLCGTTNIVVALLRAGEVPAVVNMFVIAAAAVATLVAVIAHLYDRQQGRLTALTEFLVARLNEVDSNVSDRNAGFVEGYLLRQGQQQDAAVVQFPPRMHSRRLMSGSDD